MVMNIDESTVIVALLSGTVGAGITAYLNYKIHLKLMEKDKQDREEKAAYVHLVQINDYVALELLLDTLMKGLEPVINNPKDPAIPEGANFEMSHGIAVIIEEMLNSMEQEKLSEFREVAKYVDIFTEGFKKFDLSYDELVSLPKVNINHYHQFRIYANHIKQTLQVVKIAIEGENIKTINAEVIHGLWLSTKSFFEAAKQLRYALIYSSKISQDHAHKMLTEQYEVLQSQVRNKFINDSKLKDAAEFIKSQKEEKSNKDQ